MAIKGIEKVHLKKLIKELSSYRALHTEFVTVYIPSGYNLDKIISHLNDEKGTATNIKSASTRKNVESALEKIIVHLKTYKSTPKNGLMVFAGNVASHEGKQDLRLWYFIPTSPLNQRVYRCDKNFMLDALTNYLVDETQYGLVVLDRRDAILALLKNKAIITLQRTHSEVPGKFKAGGQSAQRFARLREGAYRDHFKKVSEYMKEQFLPLGNNLKGIIIGGPGVTVNDFLNKDYITGDLKRKIIGHKDLSYTDMFGLQELLDRSEDLLHNEEIAIEKNAVQDFFQQFRDDPSKAIYGMDEVNRALEMSAIKILLVSESIDEDIVLALEEKVVAGGSILRLISTETREGVQLQNLGGIAAILRFPIQ